MKNLYLHIDINVYIIYKFQISTTKYIFIKMPKFKLKTIEHKYKLYG